MADHVPIISVTPGSAKNQTQGGTVESSSFPPQPIAPIPLRMASLENNSRSKRSWIAKYSPRPGSSGGRPGSSNGIARLPTPTEGQELSLSPVNRSVYLPIESPPPSRPGTPKRWSSSSLLTTPSSSPKPALQELDQQASQLIRNALERSSSPLIGTVSSSLKPFDRNSGSGFGKMASMMGSVLSLSRTSTNNSVSSITLDDKESRGRSMLQKDKNIRSLSAVGADMDSEGPSSRNHSRARSQSPFTFRRFRPRDPSPTNPQPLPLAQGDIELADPAAVRPHSTAYTDEDSGDETVGETTDAETEDEEWSDDEVDIFDPVTEWNTERNALTDPAVVKSLEDNADIDPDPLGEGVNVVVPPEPYFPSTLNTYNSSVGPHGSIRGRRNPKRRKSTKHYEPLPCETSRPIFQRDRCTITITQGDPTGKLGNRKKRRYVVASDLSEESRYAVEWGIGTVLRDGDEMIIVTIVENESKVDPLIPTAGDRAIKLRCQQELKRQGMAYILVRQATSLLQRTKLNVSISCQAWHAKNSRHMLLDIVDYKQPQMLIVGSRGLGQLKGILLGSTSHYLIQKCSVPVMVARRRLKRPPKKNAHLSKHRSHVSLAEAGIDRVAAKVDEDVKVMRDEIQRDDDRRDGGVPSNSGEGPGIGLDDDDDEVEGEGDEGTERERDQPSPLGTKVAG